MDRSYTSGGGSIAVEDRWNVVGYGGYASTLGRGREWGTINYFWREGGGLLELGVNLKWIVLSISGVGGAWSIDG